MTADPGDIAAAKPPSSRRWWVILASTLGFGFWWLCSLLLHTSLFGLLYLVSPKSPSPQDVAAEDFHMTISPEHVESVVAEIRQQQKEEFTKKVDQMAAIKAQLDAMDVQKIQQYNALMKEEAEQAPQLAKEALAEARANQEAALKAQAEAQAAMKKMQEAQSAAQNAQHDDEAMAADKQDAAATEAAQKAQDTAGQAQKKVAAAQFKLIQQANVLGNTAANAKQAEQAATKAQAEAERQQDTADSQRDNIRRERRQVEQQEAEVQRDHTGADAAKERVATIRSRLEQLQTPPATPAPTPMQAPATPAPASPDSATASPPPANVVAGDASTPAQATPPPAPTPVPTPTKQEKQELEHLTKALPQAQEAETKLSNHASEDAQKLAAKRADLARTTQQFQQNEEAARQKQQTALEAQANAEQQMNAALTKPVSAPQPAAPSISAPPAAPDNADLAQLFEQAQQMESAVAESYKNVRAADLAAIRKIPLSQALTLTEVAKPVRDPIDTKALTKDIRDVQGVREQEKTIDAASAQMNSMVALAERMKELAQPSQATTVDVATMKATADQSERMEQLAMEDEGTKAKDLTAAMKEPEHSAAGEGGEAGNAADGEAMAKATAAVAAASAKLAANPLDPQAALEYQRAIMALQALTAAHDGAHGGSMAGSGGQNAVPEIPVIDAKDFKPIPGRTVTGSMLAAPSGRDPSWMFVDSWYLIGPWPNPGRKNLDTKFPPETVVDLDATYTGGRKNSAPLPVRWKFYQASAIRAVPQGDSELTGEIVPPGLDEFEIYYAYTELWFDEAADLWVAIGSDDQSKVWLNDQMIWKSADYYKGWTANEGLRKIHFNKGINRLLYRLENGWLNGGYSFMICLNPKAPPAKESRATAGH